MSVQNTEITLGENSLVNYFFRESSWILSHACFFYDNLDQDGVGVCEIQGLCDLKNGVRL